MRDIVVIGTSAGGVEALVTVMQGIPARFAGSIFIVLHLSPDSPSQLASILQRVAKIPVEQATSGQRFRKGHIFVCPPNFHLLLQPGRTMQLDPGPRENRHRPAVNPLFRSAAVHYRRSVIGVILTGNLDDGTTGLAAIKQMGGVTIVQDPVEALAPGMPQSAQENVEIDHCLSLSAIPGMLAQLVVAKTIKNGSKKKNEQAYKRPTNGLQTAYKRPTEGKDQEGVPALTLRLPRLPGVALGT